ncbi:MAG: 3-oxoadipyl-CoA thiolase [Proteobacteria bacterium]|nr:3-oxoadipyl-CoA thiolase [Pseudomonadota bacterium]
MKNAFLCDAVRTPFGRYGGALAAVRTDDLAAIPLRALLQRNPSLDPAAVEEVYYGCANQAGEDNRNLARMAVLLAGLPESVPAATVNRLCGSGMDAIAMLARAMKAGEVSLGLAGGAESMTRAPFVLGKPDAAFSRAAKLEDTTLGWRFINPAFKKAFGVDSMAETAENVVAQYGIARADQDAFALRSQQRCAKAQAAGRFAQEIVAVSVPQGRGEPKQVSVDEHPRADATLEGLAKLKGVVKPEGSVTAGNASGINDGSAAVLMATEEAAKAAGLTPRARVLAAATAGVAPRIMGMGPVPATRKVLALAGLDLKQMDVIELNEAFAGQALAVLRELGLPDDAEHVNPNGGAIALGHPLGASGARLVATALYELQRRGGRYALCTMCIGVGQGIAMIIERV